MSNRFECYNVKTKVYTNQDIEYIYYKKGIVSNKPDIEEMNKGKPSNRGQADNPERSIHVSKMRTIQKVYDYARSNEWEYFITLTFNPDKVNRQDYSECTKKLKNWLDNLKRKYSPGLKYIMVPELHKDGVSYHFHGLISNIGNMMLGDSGKKTKDGDVIYNIGNYRLGWSTATKINYSDRASKYLCKYITKDLCAVTFNKRRYWNSKNLEIPKIDKRFISNKAKDIEIENIETIAQSKKECSVPVTDQHITYYRVGFNKQIHSNVEFEES